MSETTTTPSTSSKTPLKILIREYSESLLVAVVLALVLRFFVVSAYKIPTGSMIPTLKVGDLIFAYRLPYGFPVPFSGGDRWSAKLPERGDVVVFRYPGNESVNYVKRVVGLPGDRIQIRNKHLFVNDKEAGYVALTSDSIKDLPGGEDYEVFSEKLEDSTHSVILNRADETDFFGPVVVPPGHFFVLGDNRDSSDDSRYWGTVPLRNLEGKVVLVWMSLDWLHRWADDRLPTVRWERVFTSVD